MFITRLLVLTLLSVPQEAGAPPAFREAAAEFVAVFDARDGVRLAGFWSPQVPKSDEGAIRLQLLALVPGKRTTVATYDEQRHVVRLDLHDFAGVLIEQYDATFRLEDGQWRLVSLTAAPTKEVLPRARELLYRGSYLLDTGHAEEAVAAYTEAAELAETTTHATTRAAAQSGLGNVASFRGDTATARRHFENSLAIARAAGNAPSVSRALDRLAALDVIAGDLDTAEERLREALQLARQSKDRFSEAYMLNALGNVRNLRSDFKGGNAYYADALKIFEELGNEIGISTMLNNMGINARTLGQYEQSMALFRRSLELTRSLDYLDGMAHSWGNLAIAFALQGNLTEALQAHHEALRLQERRGEPEPIVRTLMSVGDMYRKLGNVEQARAHFEKGLAMAEKLGFRSGIADGLQNLGELRSDTGDPRGAIELYEKAVAINTEIGDRPGIGSGIRSIGRAQLLVGDRAAARRSFERSLAIAEEVGTPFAKALSLGMLGRLTDDSAQAVALSRRAVELATELGLPEIRWQSHLALGLALQRARKADEARPEFERALSIVEELRRDIPGGEVAQQQAFESLVVPYHAMIALLVEQGDHGTAFEHAERAKGRALLDVLHNGRPDLRSLLTDEEKAREASLSADLAQVNRELHDAAMAGAPKPELAAKLRTARLEYDAFTNGLYAAHPQLRSERGDVTPLRATDLGALLASGAADAFLEFVVTDERTYLFTITKKGDGVDLRVETIAITRDALETEVRAFRELLATHDLTYARAGRALYDRLLRPIAAQFRGKQTLCIVPDGPLWELPFQALQPAGDEFLLDRHALYSVPSLTVLREMSSRSTPRSGPVRLLALGNPVIPSETERRAGTFRDTPLAPLPHAETEVRAIAELYGKNNSRVHLRAAAREEVVKAESGRFDVLHFATHGVLDDQNALYSRLVFSPPTSKTEDGLLEAREIMRLDLHAGLAVLSACETARGSVSTGEGLIGMSWALFVAGVPTTVVSQWKVDSSSTAELMIELHRNLRVAGRTKAEALRRAALKTRREYRHPFYWAPFVVLGSTR